MGAAWFHSFATCVGFRFWNIIYHHFQVVSLTVFHSFLGFCCCLVWFRHQKYWQCRIAQQQSEKISKSRQRAAGFLQTEDTNTTFSLNSSLPLCLFTSLFSLATSATRDGEISRVMVGRRQIKITHNSPQMHHAEVTSLSWKCEDGESSDICVQM